MSEPVQEQSRRESEFEQVSYPRLVRISLVNPVPQSLTSMSGTISFGVASIFPNNYEKEVAEWILLNSHAARLDALVKSKTITEEDKKETLKQHKVLLDRYVELSQHNGKTVVACGDQLFVGDNLDDAVKKAKQTCGNKPYYAETINLIAFSALFPPSAD